MPIHGTCTKCGGETQDYWCPNCAADERRNLEQRLYEVNHFELVREFHRKFGVPVLPSPQMPPAERRSLRFNLISEEYLEVCDALESGNLANLAKELCDLIIVCHGTALEYGIDLNAAFVEVHRSNMSKLDGDGRPVLRESDGKVLKGPNYVVPDVNELSRPAIKNGMNE